MTYNLGLTELMWHIIIKLTKTLTAFIFKIPQKRGMEMGTIVCQTCNHTIDIFEDEKVTTLYGTCNHCDDKNDMSLEEK